MNSYHRHAYFYDVMCCRELLRVGLISRGRDSYGLP